MQNVCGRSLTPYFWSASCCSSQLLFPVLQSAFLTHTCPKATHLGHVVGALNLLHEGVGHHAQVHLSLLLVVAHLKQDAREGNRVTSW